MSTSTETATSECVARFVTEFKLLVNIALSYQVEHSNPEQLYAVCDRLVEEFMLLANMAVAHQIYRSNPELALLRRHAHPQSRLMEALQEQCDHIGLNIDMSSAGALHVSHTITCKAKRLKRSIITLSEKDSAEVIVNDLRGVYCVSFLAGQSLAVF